MKKTAYHRHRNLEKRIQSSDADMRRTLQHLEGRLSVLETQNHILVRDLVKIARGNNERNQTS